MTSKIPNRPGLAALSALLLSFALGCRSPQIDFVAVDAVLEQHISREMDAEAVPIESELRDRVGALRARAAQDPEAPRHLAAILNVGQDALTARLHLIRSARSSVDLQVYVWADDLAGGLVFYELWMAARRGVRVRILLDQLANRTRGYCASITLAHENIEIQVYNPVRDFTTMPGPDLARDAIGRFERLNERMHNKVMIVDEEVAIVGGRNIEEHYFDLDGHFAYLDRDLLVAGPGAREAAQSFQDYWDDEISIPMSRVGSVARDLLRYGEGEWQLDRDPDKLVEVTWVWEQAGLRALDEVMPHTTFHEVDRVEFDADPPEKDGVHYWNTWKRELGAGGQALTDSQESILLQSNYLVISQTGRNFLQGCIDRGVQISYSTNSLATTANILTYSASRKQKLGLIHQGLDIRELRPGMKDLEHFLPRIEELVVRDEAGELVAQPQVAIHAKSVVIDRRVAIVGSHNLDPRSSLYNTEASFVIWDEGLAGELEAELELMMGEGNSWICHHVDYVPVWSDFNEVLAAFSRALPVLDVWPWRGYAMYELREGMEPVAVGDPAFFSHYERVGELPEVDSTSKEIKTRLFTTVIAPFWNLL